MYSSDIAEWLPNRNTEKLSK